MKSVPTAYDAKAKEWHRLFKNVGVVFIQYPLSGESLGRMTFVKKALADEMDINVEVLTPDGQFVTASVKLNKKSVQNLVHDLEAWLKFGWPR
jgi:hypothetical protein